MVSAVALQVTLKDLHKCCKREATWTIDIAYLLREYGLACVFYTTMRGVRPEYFFQTFYRRLLDPRDPERVIERFRNAERSGVKVSERTVSLSEIRSTVSQNDKLLLVLVDRCLLRRSLCVAKLNTSNRYRSSHGFLGHYVLLYAFHEASDNFLVKDPASFQEFCVVPASNLEIARKAFGTDEDIIFIGDVINHQEHKDVSSSSVSQPGLSAQPALKTQRNQRDDGTERRHSSELAKSMPPVSRDTPSSSSSTTVGRDILNFILRRVLGVATPRTRLP